MMLIYGSMNLYLCIMRIISPWKLKQKRKKWKQKE